MVYRGLGSGFCSTFGSFRRFFEVERGSLKLFPSTGPATQAQGLEQTVISTVATSDLLL